MRKNTVKQMYEIMLNSDVRFSRKPGQAQNGIKSFGDG